MDFYKQKYTVLINDNFFLKEDFSLTNNFLYAKHYTSKNKAIEDAKLYHKNHPSDRIYFLEDF
jgi:hypothetical protein